MDLFIDRDYLLETAVDLVRINSVNPSLVPGSPGESEIAAYTADSLRQIGLEVAVHETQPGRPSVVGILRGSGEGRSLMLNAHLDTVGSGSMVRPFSPQIRDGKLYGRGAYDMKGSLASCLATAKALVERDAQLRGDLLVAAVADEEFASLGTAGIMQRYRVDGAIVTEPTGLDLCLAHKGFIWFEVETIGRAAHGSRFDLGVDANMLMGRFLVELEKLGQELQSGKGHPLAGPPSLHAAKIRGGTEPSIYAAHCALTVERRTIPGEDERQVTAQLQAIIKRLTEADPSFQARLTQGLTRQPFEADPQAELAKLLAESAERVLNMRPAIIGQSFWMDSALLAAAGVETVVMGPAGAGAHADEEWVEIASLVRLARILAQTALTYCGGGSR